MTPACRSRRDVCVPRPTRFARSGIASVTSPAKISPEDRVMKKLALGLWYVLLRFSMGHPQHAPACGSRMTVAIHVRLTAGPVDISSTNLDTGGETYLASVPCLVADACARLSGQRSRRLRRTTAPSQVTEAAAFERPVIWSTLRAHRALLGSSRGFRGPRIWS